MDQKNKTTQWSDPVRYIALVAFFAVIILITIMARNSLTLILLAMLIAYLLSPIVSFMIKYLHINRNLAVVIAYLLLLIFIVAMVLIIAPSISEKMQGFFAMDWPMIIGGIRTWIAEISDNEGLRQFQILGYSVDLTEPIMELENQIDALDISNIDFTAFIPDVRNALQNIFTISTGFVNRLVTFLIMLMTGIMTSIHFCKDGHKAGGWIINLFEERYRPEVTELLHRMGNVWHNYFAGELKLMAIVGLLTTLLLSALGIHLSVPLGLIAAICEVIPNIGPVLACIPAAISAIIFGSSFLPFNNGIMVLLVLIASIIVQQVENIFIVPRVMGNALDLHPVVITIGILVLSSRLGVFGALLASPAIGISREILHFVICKIRKEDPYQLEKETI